MPLTSYAGVSAPEQTLDRQMADLREGGCALIHEEHASGADRTRPALARLLARIPPGDRLVVVVLRLNRLARSLAHLLQGIETLEARGAYFRSVGDPIDTATAQGRTFSAARYPSAPLDSLIAELAGGATFGQRDRTLAVTATKLRDGAAVLFEPGAHGHFLVREAVLASCAALTMFPAVPVHGALHADEVIFANVPDLLAVELAIRKGADTPAIRTLSLSSMNASPPLGEPAKADMGVLDWS